MKYTLYSCNHELLGEVECDSIHEAELFLAMNFPNDYFGANIVGDKIKIIAVKDAFDEDITPVQAALDSFNVRVKIKNGFCVEEHDGDSILQKPCKKLVSVDGVIKCLWE